MLSASGAERTFINTYASGYPNDGCAACTNVVALACRGTGYGLQLLVSRNIDIISDCRAEIRIYSAWARIASRSQAAHPVTLPS